MAELNNTGTGKWSETDASNTSPSPDGWSSGTFPNQVEPIGRSTMGSIKRFWDRINGTVTTTGTANAYIYTPVNTSYPTAYVVGETYSFFANFSNTAAATININGLGAKNIFVKSSTGVISTSGGEIHQNDLVTVMYDGTQFQIMSSIPASVVSNPTFTGTATLNGHPIITQVIPRVFTSTSSYVPTTGMAYCTIECWGGGGGGVGLGVVSNSTYGGGGGGAGGYSRKTVAASVIGSSQTVTIGAAGAGSSTNVTGGNGGTTSVGSICIANGGNGGGAVSGNAALGGVGGSPGTGDITATGACGFSTSGSNGGTTGLGGQGGSSSIGTGGLAAISTGGLSAGNSAAGYASGGGGAAAFNPTGGSTVSGGNGTAGYVIITEFISA